MKINTDIMLIGLRKLNVFLLGVVVILLSINQSIIAPFIGLWGFSAIMLIVFEKQRFKLNKSLLYLILFYLFLVIGLSWTDNVKSGIFDLEVKMSLIIFPLVLTFLNYNLREIKYIFLYLYFGLIAGLGVLLWSAIPNYVATDSIEVFFYVYLSDKIHPSYFSFYVTIGLILACIDIKYKVLNIFKNVWQYIAIIVFLFCFNILLLSKIGIIVSCLILLIFIVIWAVDKRKYAQSLLVVASIASLLTVSYEKSKYVSQRVDEFVGSFEANESANSSTSIRFHIWEQGIKVFQSKPFIGHGTGDVKDVLVESYKGVGMLTAADKKLNAHNQYLQIAISVGLIGLVLFLLSFFFTFKAGFIEKNYYLIGFGCVSLLFLFPESMLENQAGTIAFGLFFSLFNQKSLRIE